MIKFYKAHYDDYTWFPLFSFRKLTKEDIGFHCKRLDRKPFWYVFTIIKCAWVDYWRYGCKEQYYVK